MDEMIFNFGDGEALSAMDKLSLTEPESPVPFFSNTGFSAKNNSHVR
jgi:hypothetical protein